VPGPLRTAAFTFAVNVGSPEPGVGAMGTAVGISAGSAVASVEPPSGAPVTTTTVCSGVDDEQAAKIKAIGIAARAILRSFFTLVIR
jgi:hypothetical protein